MSTLSLLKPCDLSEPCAATREAERLTGELEQMQMQEIVDHCEDMVSRIRRNDEPEEQGGIK